MGSMLELKVIVAKIDIFRDRDRSCGMVRKMEV